MHELPVVLGLVDELTEKARANRISRITDIELSIGELSDLVDECIEVYFESASAGTVCEGAALHFTHVPAKLRCPACGHVFPHERSFRCPECGGSAMLVRGTGSGFTIERFSGE